MKVAIVYYSKHHGNTKKLLECLTEENQIDLLDVTANPSVDLSDYDVIGFASGIYYSKFQKTLLQFAEAYMPQDKKTFFIYTYGAKKKGYTDAIAQAVGKHNATVLGEFGCFGFNTFGPFKLIGGIAKGHPDDRDFHAVRTFYSEIIQA